MSEWQSIETAPTDGTWVLTWDAEADRRHPGDIEETMCIAHVNYKGFWSILLDGQSCRPTHWMPLPEPPK